MTLVCRLRTAECHPPSGLVISTPIPGEKRPGFRGEHGYSQIRARVDVAGRATRVASRQERWPGVGVSQQLDDHLQQLHHLTRFKRLAPAGGDSALLGEYGDGRPVHVLYATQRGHIALEKKPVPALKRRKAEEGALYWSGYRPITFTLNV